jgi:hypothetical protein
MKRQIPIGVVCGLVLLSVGLSVSLVLSMKSFTAFQDTAGADRHHNPRIVHAEDIGDTSVVYGQLNRPIGVEMIIHGAAEKSMGGNFRVDAVNGVKVDGREITVLGARSCPPGTKATLRGKEESKIALLPPENASKSPTEPGSKDRQKVLCAFKPSKVVEPQGLALKGENS